MTESPADRPAIDYPAEWSFKVIGTDEDAVRSAVATVLDETLTPDSGDREFEVGFSRESKGGKYLSVGLTLIVLSQDERDRIFGALKKHPDVLMVM